MPFSWILLSICETLIFYAISLFSNGNYRNDWINNLLNIYFCVEAKYRNQDPALVQLQEADVRLERGDLDLRRHARHGRGQPHAGRDAGVRGERRHQRDGGWPAAHSVRRE